MPKTPEEKIVARANERTSLQEAVYDAQAAFAHYKRWARTWKGFAVVGWLAFFSALYAHPFVTDHFFGVTAWLSGIVGVIATAGAIAWYLLWRLDAKDPFEQLREAQSTLRLFDAQTDI